MACPADVPCSGLVDYQAEEVCLKPYYEEKGITIYHGDCLEAMRLIPDASIDACISDPPYGTTACSWDAVIPFAPMWVELKRIVKKNGAIVLFGSQPFTSALVMSNPQMFKYSWVWNKERPGIFFVAKTQPLRVTEDIVVFCADTAKYNAQMTEARPENMRPRDGVTPQRTDLMGRIKSGLLHAKADHDETARFPNNIISISSASSECNQTNRIHPTQKPVELMRYLARTYTNEGDTVLDFTCGSGSTGVACVIERRRFIGIEQDKHWCEVSDARVKRAQGVAGDIPKSVKRYAPTPLFDEVLNFEEVA